MNQAIRQVLDGQADNHILPFFWQHGEDEKTLKDMMAVIHNAGCGAVCVESRPHPDFCGEKWWKDMDVILEEARNRGMKVWILDDSHFPTGYANGALREKPDTLCRQNIFLKEKLFAGKSRRLLISLKKEGWMKPVRSKRRILETLSSFENPVRRFSDDSVLSVTARCGREWMDLTDSVKNNILVWEKPEGEWILSVITRSRNTGAHHDYINMTEEASCRVLIDAVYEPHWAHYGADFGKTIAGFFSDEPELGNGRLYAKGNHLGTEQDLPWGQTMEEAVAEALGPDWRGKLYLLWREGKEAQIVRSRYMDVLTRRVRIAFSRQISDWCHAHGVEYIGHIIEDDGQHCRTGSSLGHYFRGLQYQDMAGIDDIGGQVLPQGEDAPGVTPMREPRNGEFYHYGLAKLAQSAAAIEHRKQGRAMCEIFGNYGWGEGVRLEKYLADHFLVQGINYFVPHAFTGKPFPDPDCPPHFYAQGHNPQYRHFGALMGYMNRVATLTSSGRHNVPVAILYHGEMEWADGAAMPFEKPLRALYDCQIDCHTVPADIFSEPEYYRTQIGSVLVVNGQKYRAFIVPGCRALPKAAAEGIEKLMKEGLPVFFVEPKPQTVAETGEAMPQVIRNQEALPLEDLCERIRLLSLEVPVLVPVNSRVRVLHVLGDSEMYFLVNEGCTAYQGILALPTVGNCYAYDPWCNTCHPVSSRSAGACTEVTLAIEPLKSVFVVFGTAPGTIPDTESIESPDGREILLTSWKRGVCEGKEYPTFHEERIVTLPDNLAKEMPRFSGFARYETSIPKEVGRECRLEISDAAEGVEVFLNGRSLGIQIVPPFCYSLTLSQEGDNCLAIEVATTLERQAYPRLNLFQKWLYGKPAGGSGLTGTVRLIQI